ncbi:MAG: bifunctional precorrin-2 dehydrogenase/sirohydrochlorin ferrochelatase [Candidatus Omnitrophota bacterium]
MRYYPAFLDLHGRLCCVVGGGTIAGRKARSLLAAGARVEVISPDLSKALEPLARKRLITYRNDIYQKKYIRNAFLVIAATSDPLVNRRVSADAAELRILSNIVDRPAQSNFIVPAVLSKNGLIIGISTSGKAPSLSKRIKQDLRKTVLGKYVRALGELSRARSRLKKCNAGSGARKHILARIADNALQREIL